MQSHKMKNKYEFNDIKMYHPSQRDMVKINIMFGNLIGPKYFIKERLDSSYVAITDKDKKVTKSINWALILFGYVAGYVLEEAFDNNIISKEEYISYTSEILLSHVIQQETPLHIIWGLFCQIQEKQHAGCDMDSVVELTIKYYNENKDKLKAENNNSEVTPGVLTFDFTKGLNDHKNDTLVHVINPSKPIIEKKTIVKGFTAEQPTLLTISSNHSKQLL